MDWERHAKALADAVTLPASLWRPAIEATPRHLFVPRWWDLDQDIAAWTVRDGAADEQAWMATAYSDESLVTEMSGRHADLAATGERITGRPTSSSTLPSLVVQMYRHACLYDGADILDVGTGSGYGAALLAARFGGERITTIDVDPYLTKVSAERLDELGQDPTVVTGDATADLPGTYDRIVAMVSMRPVPKAWLRALRPGGRLVLVIEGTSLILTANKVSDDDPVQPGWAVGEISWDRATFMRSRHGPGPFPDGGVWFTDVQDADGEHVSTGRYPVLNVLEAWDVADMLQLAAPSVEIVWKTSTDAVHTLLLQHPDGSWARATGTGDELPTVHQSGPRRLWDELDAIRHYWITHGELPARGARAFVSPDGTIHLARDDWRATVK